LIRAHVRHLHAKKQPGWPPSRTQSRLHLAGEKNCEREFVPFCRADPVNWPRGADAAPCCPYSRSPVTNC
jgi:hypothetical protein